jgi:hypothetical protein
MIARKVRKIYAPRSAMAVPPRPSIEAPREVFETIIIDPPWPMTKIDLIIQHATWLNL